MIEPQSLAARPHLGRLPIPFVTAVDERTGRPDFRAHDDVRRLDVALNGLCQLCGTPLGVAALVGTGHSIFHDLTFGEPPAHPDCLDYAFEVCPWLAGAAWSDRWRTAARDVEVLPPPSEADALFIVLAEKWIAIPDEERGKGYKFKAIRPIISIERRERR